jgi:spore maturation protein SpmB
MESFISVILQAGHNAITVSLFTLMPIMIVMMVFVRLLESKGVLEFMIRVMAPVMKPFGLSGLGVLAMLQISFVSFAAPLPTLALMEDRGESDRRLASTLAGVLAMAPANATFPLASMGLHSGLMLLTSMIGGISAAALTFWVCGRALSNSAHAPNKVERQALKDQSLLNIINVSGGEAVRITLNIIPMLLLSLVVVLSLQRAGLVNAIKSVAAYPLSWLGISEEYVLPTLTKYLAGSTALVGLVDELRKQGHFNAYLINHSAAFLVHPLDLPGVAILMSAGARVGKVIVPALTGGILGILVRTAFSTLFL